MVKTFFVRLACVVLLASGLSLELTGKTRQIILDTDWWTDVDDAMAVRLALRADERDEIRLMGICVDAAAAEPCADFYRRILPHSRRKT